MQITTISQFRKSLKDYIDRVEADKEPLIIARNDGTAVVTIPLDEYNALTETHYLMSNPANARHIQKGIDQVRSGKAKMRELIQP